MKYNTIAIALLTTSILGAPVVAAAADPAVNAAAAAAEARPERDAKAMPALFHIPRAQAVAGEPVRLNIETPGDWRYESFWLMWRPVDEEEWRPREFKRSAEVVHATSLTHLEVQAPGFEYYIFSRDPEGVERLHFGSAESPHPVAVHGETEYSRMMDKLERHKGNRSEFKLDVNYTSMGSRNVDVVDLSAGDDVTTDPDSDFYWSAEVGYTFRPLTRLYDFSFGVGRMRGERGTVTLGGSSFELSSDLAQPGMDYGWGSATFEFHRFLSAQGKLILGASSRGFAAGVGGLLRVGQISGTNLELSVDLVQDIGNEASVRFNWDTVPYVPMSLRVDLNERPGGGTNPLARRLVYSAGVELGRHVVVTGEVGVASRNDSVEAGLVGGLQTTVSF